MSLEQLSLFETAPIPHYNFWKENFGYEAKVGDTIRIDEPIAYCETLMKDSYCMSMRAKIIEISGDHSKVETTQEWEDACKGSCQGVSTVNKAGNIWRVKVKNLAPIFNK